MSFVRESIVVGGKTLTLETGRLAKQAHGAVIVSCEGSVVLVTAVSAEERPGLDFFPLTCEYQEKTYAAGKIPGGFFKREGRLRENEILTSRIIDRPRRPLFPEGTRRTRIATVCPRTDQSNGRPRPERASAALHISDTGRPIAGIRVARVDGEFVAYPTFSRRQGGHRPRRAVSKDAIVMVEGGADETKRHHRRAHVRARAGQS
jgi:polyribonucleotide nucleotidyltransferase